MLKKKLEFKQYTDKFWQFVAFLKAYAEKMKGWDWKVISICAITAFTFWIFNALNGSHTTNLSIPLRFEYSEENVVMLAKPPKSVTVNVSGNGWDLFRRGMSLSSDPLKVSFSNSLLFDINFLLTKDFLPQIAGKLRDIKVNYILEDSVFFNYDTLARKQVTLAVKEENIPLAANYRIVSDILVEPKEVALTGASSLLKTYPDTFYLTLEEIVDGKVSEKVEVEYPKHRLVSIEQEEALISFMVTRFERRSITVVPEFVYLPEDLEVTLLPSPSQAKISYLIEADEHYMPQDTLKILLDYREINFEDSTACPRLVCPDYFFEVDVTPDKFSITLEK